MFDVVTQADAEGWLVDLVTAAREARPGNPAFVLAARHVGLTEPRESFERILATALPYTDTSPWLSRFGELEGRICRIEVHGSGAVRPLGTGFLIDVDLCVTNHHVLTDVLTGRIRPADVRLRFDYRRSPDGRDLNSGTLFGLAEPWFAALSPPSPLDLEDRTDGAEPGPDQIDIAVLRVADRPGESAVGRSDRLPDPPPRGWIPLGSADAGPTDPIFVLQHPVGDPLQVAAGPVLSVNHGRTRLRHRANTRPGSSGSPCFDANLDLVAVHHAGDPLHESLGSARYNSAIPMHALRSWLDTLDPPVSRHSSTP